ncbi:MAG: PIF1 family DEAD/DEAH box helicase [bacterium]
MNQQEALSILKLGVNVFLTGEPGAGKTYVVNQYVAYLRERGVYCAITASTGIAATHIGGMTIHSWSGVGIREMITDRDVQIIAAKEHVARRIKRTKVLIIDEISMISPDTLSAIDAVCRKVHHTDLPFGGMQIVLVGDFFQLPPVRKNGSTDTHRVIFEEKEQIFAYDSSAWIRSNLAVCYLTEQHRQDDVTMSSVLLAIRRNCFNQSHMLHIKARRIELHQAPADVTKLFSHNVNVDKINDERLKELSGEPKHFVMSSEGSKALVESLKRNCLSKDDLVLKLGAKVMFTKNNAKDGFVNGTLGTVVSFHGDTGFPIVTLTNGKRIEVYPMDWSIEDGGKAKAKITQLPLRLAWAITVHKSQGMSLDEAVMDLSEVFEFGQGYVALSRVKKLSGVHILGWNEKAFQVHPEILAIDERFRFLSEGAVARLKEFSSTDLNEKQKAFIIACGGKNKKIISAPWQKKEKAIRDNTAFEDMKQKYPNAYTPWSEEDDFKLGQLFLQKLPVAKIAKILQRQQGGITARLLKLGLLEKKGGYTNKV